MDSDGAAFRNGVEVAHQNGVHKKMAPTNMNDDNVGLTKGIKCVPNNEKPSNHKSLAATGAAAKSQLTQSVKSIDAPSNNGKPNQSKPALKSEDEVSDSVMDDMKLKPLKKGPGGEPENDAISTSSPMAGDAKPQRVGSLPNYGFSFKCDERAEKRKEFYSKLEEKIHAKEVERTNLQAKSKETQEAEIKLLRKNLNFKATPMPNFYQEPAPPKAELKKTPPTRAKSPKLGRRKNLATEESEESKGIDQFNRMSLDVNATRRNAVQSPCSVNPNQPIRRSLPKLPSEKTTLSGGGRKSSTALKASHSNQTPSAKEDAILQQEHES